MISIHTDGACSGNPGPGGWAAIIVRPDGHVLELGGHESNTTNNRMEMMAVIQALKHIESLSGPVTIQTDSTYVIDGITKWISSWKRRGWLTAAKEPVKNSDLWKVLDAAVSSRVGHQVQWRWVRGHSGHDANERCDEIAVAFSRRKKIELYSGDLKTYSRHLTLAEGEANNKIEPVYLSLVDGSLERH
jgi:ribonuclease HI